MRMGLSFGTVVHSAPPTLVWMPVRPSTQAIGVGQSVPVTTSRVAAGSSCSLVNGGAPWGNSPSSITSRFTLAATRARPPSGLPCPDFDRRSPARLVSAPSATTVTLWSGCPASRRRKRGTAPGTSLLDRTECGSLATSAPV